MIWIDIGHLAQFNFFKNLIIKLCDRYDVMVTVLDRGSLSDIVTNELSQYSNISIKTIGKHKKTKLGIYWNSNLIRIIKLAKFFIQFKPKLSISNGYQAALIGMIFGIPRLQFGDDPEHKDYELKKLFASKSMYCIPGLKDSRIRTLECPKEWAYLSPYYFEPSLACLSKYGIKPFEYIFIRIVDTSTTNYSEQSQILLLQSGLRIPHGVKVLLSLERRFDRNFYPKDWILIDEIEPNIHSYLYYSRLMISTGDSMAREGASLGVKSIYCGNRSMRANQIYIQEGLLYQETPHTLNSRLDELLTYKDSKSHREQVRNALLGKWIDPNIFIMDMIESEMQNSR